MTPVPELSRTSPHPLIFRLLALFLVAAWFSGCSYFSNTVEKTSKTIKRTSRRVSREISWNSADLKHRAAIGDFKTIASDPQGAIKQFFDAGLPNFLDNHCPLILTDRSGPSSPSTLLREPPRLATGQIDAFALSIIGRQLGVNAVVIGSLKSLRRIEELRGILNKETVYHVRIALRMEIYQPLTATKILDNIYRRDVPLEEMDFQKAEDLSLEKLPQLTEILSDMLEEIGGDVCDALLEQPWSGYVTSVENDHLVISAGSEAGLKPGMQLDAFDSSQTIEGADGQRYFLPGAKTARIQILNVSENRSEAEVVDGGAIKAGSSVHPGS